MLQFSEYCEQTAQRIKELKVLLFKPQTEEEERNRLRNQISAYQARLKSRIASMDQQVRLDQKDAQIRGVIKIAASFLSDEQKGAFLQSVNKRLPELDTSAREKAALLAEGEPKLEKKRKIKKIRFIINCHKIEK